MAGAGQPKTGGGSRKGIPNKTTTELKEMVLGALSDAGGQSYLATQARENPSAYLSLLGRVLPHTIVGGDGGPAIQVTLTNWTPPAKPSSDGKRR